MGEEECSCWSRDRGHWLCVRVWCVPLPYYSSRLGMDMRVRLIQHHFIFIFYFINHSIFIFIFYKGKEILCFILISKLINLLIFSLDLIMLFSPRLFRLSNETYVFYVIQFF